MKHSSNIAFFMTIFLVLSQVITACSLPAKSAESTPNLQATIDAAVQATGPVAAPTNTPDLQATVDAAIQATNSAGQAVQATVDNAVTATIGALPPTATLIPTTDYYTLSEEELAAMIDSAVAEAVTASEQTSTTTTQATSDGTISDSEVETLEIYCANVDQALAYADELIGIYYDLYGEYATETITLITEIEQDLAAIAESTAQTAAILEQGAAAANAAIEQLNQAAQNTSATIDQIQAASEGWGQKVKSELEARAATFQDLQPTEVIDTQLGAIQQLYEYLDTIKLSFTDKIISPNELSDIFQLGINASASLNLTGNPNLQGFSGKINNMNNQLAHGQWSGVQRDLNGFETSLPTRPPKRHGRP